MGGYVLEGKWIAGDLDKEQKETYRAKTVQFRSMDVIPEPGRYVLIVSWACIFCHRTMLVQALRGLEDVIPIIYTNSHRGEDGWSFGESAESGNDDDKVGLETSVLFKDMSNRQNVTISNMYEIYLLAQSNYTGRASAPVLWDTVAGTVVNNESSDIVRIMLDNFASLAKMTERSSNIATLRSFPKDDDEEAKVQAMIKENFIKVNIAPYQCALPDSQESYDKLANALFDRLDELEDLLSRQRYLMGNEYLTVADMYLFPTLFRFDLAYYPVFKCNRKHLYEYPNLWAYTREIYQQPGVKETCNSNEIKIHYYTSYKDVHPRGFIALGSNMVDFNEDHARDTMRF